MAHQYYQPTEHEAMLIAAGWIDRESVDADYAKYLKDAPKGDAMTYDQWIACKREWDELDAQYERIIAPVFRERELTANEREVQKALLDQMSWLEILLGY